jgi:hypothetical protein
VKLARVICPACHKVAATVVRLDQPSPDPQSGLVMAAGSLMMELRRTHGNALPRRLFDELAAALRRTHSQGVPQDLLPERPTRETVVAWHPLDVGEKGSRLIDCGRAGCHASLRVDVGEVARAVRRDSVATIVATPYPDEASIP